jgi:hypothetical protein
MVAKYPSTKKSHRSYSAPYFFAAVSFVPPGEVSRRKIKFREEILDFYTKESALDSLLSLPPTCPS